MKNRRASMIIDTNRLKKVSIEGNEVTVETTDHIHVMTWQQFTECKLV